MKEVFERIKERLKEWDKYSKDGLISVVGVVDIVNQVAEEYNRGLTENNQALTNEDSNCCKKCNNWIPCSEETPKYAKYDIEKVWVTMRRKTSTYYFVRRLIWDGSRGMWLFDNGKEVSDMWEVVAWQPIEVPTPYNPKGEAYGQAENN